MEEKERIELLKKIEKMNRELQEYLIVLAEKYSMPMAMMYFNEHAHGAFTAGMEFNMFGTENDDHKYVMNNLMLAKACKKLLAKVEGSV